MEAPHVVFDTLPVVVDYFLDGRMTEQFCVSLSPENSNEVAGALSSGVKSWDVKYLERHLLVLHTVSEEVFLEPLCSSDDVDLLDTVGTFALDLVHDSSFGWIYLALRCWNVHSFVLAHSSVKEITDSREAFPDSRDY